MCIICIIDWRFSLFGAGLGWVVVCISIGICVLCIHINRDLGLMLRSLLSYVTSGFLTSFVCILFVVSLGIDY